MNYAENPDWTLDLAALLSQSWHALSPEHVTDRLSARVANLATLGADGSPESRFVILRACDPHRGSVDVYTDASTPKCAQIAADPRAAVTLWREDMLLQLRLSGTIEIIEGAQARAAWSALPDRSLPDYGVTPAPGHDIPHATAYARNPNAARFAILRMTMAHMDVVSLNRPTHTRAFFERRDGWRGTWRAP